MSTRPSTSPCTAVAHSSVTVRGYATVRERRPIGPLMARSGLTDGGVLRQLLTQNRRTCAWQDWFAAQSVRLPAAAITIQRLSLTLGTGSPADLSPPHRRTRSSSQTWICALVWVGGCVSTRPMGAHGLQRHSIS